MTRRKLLLAAATLALATLTIGGASATATHTGQAGKADCGVSCPKTPPCEPCPDCPLSGCPKRPN
jgi:hypothetical protein